MNVWGRNLRLHIPLKDIFLMHYFNGSLKFEITAKRLYAASQRVL